MAKILEGINVRKYRDLTRLERVLRFFGLLVPDVVVLDFFGRKIPKMGIKIKYGKVPDFYNSKPTVKYLGEEPGQHVGYSDCTMDIKPFPLLDSGYKK